MVSRRTQMHCLGARSLLAISLLSLAGIFAAGYATAAGSGPAKSDTRLRELLTRRYEILQKMVETSRLSLEAGRVDVFSHQNLLDALYRAQADLATTTPERVQVYEKLIEALSENERLAERQAEAGRLVAIQVMQVKLVTLNARIDLERLRLGQAAAQ